MREGKRPRVCKSYPYRLEVRTTEGEKHRIAALARARGVSRSRYLVRLALEGRPAPTREEREELRLLRCYLEKAGTNLHQLAHRANRAALRGEPLPPQEEILSVLRGVRLLSREIRRRLL